MFSGEDMYTIKIPMLNLFPGKKLYFAIEADIDLEKLKYSIKEKIENSLGRKLRPEEEQLLDKTFEHKVQEYKKHINEIAENIIESLLKEIESDIALTVLNKIVFK